MTDVTATDFRRNLFQLMDAAEASGEPVVIRRRGRRFVLRAEPEPPVDRWARYDAWIAERRASGELPPEPMSDEEDEARWALAKQDLAEGMAEAEAEWDEFYGPERREA